MYHLLGEYRKATGSFEAALRDKQDLLVPNLFLGLDLLQLHKPKEALPYLQRAQRLDPREGRAALALGQAHADLREFPEANSWYFRAAQLNSKDAEALYGLGITYLHLHNTAAKDLGMKGPDSPYDKRLLAESMEQQDRTADAINVYKKLLESQTRWPGLHTALGFDYLAQREVPKAKAEFQAELGRNPGFLLARLGLACSLVEEGNSDGWMQEIEGVWKSDPNFLRANISRFSSGLPPEKVGALRKKLNQETSGASEANLKSLLQDSFDRPVRGPTNEVSRNAQGGGLPNPQKAPAGDESSASLLYQRGHYTACEQKIGHDLGRLDRESLLLLARCGYYSGDYRTSFLSAGQLLTKSSEDLEALYWRAASSSKLAISALLSAGLADPESYRVHLLLGGSYRDMKKYKESETEYKKALEIRPKEPAVRLGLATLYWQSRKYDSAVPELEEVLAARPGDPEASYLMGDILVGRHQFSDAQPYLTAALGATGKTVYYAHALLGKIDASQDHADEAIKQLKQALPGDDDGSFHFQIYQLYKKVGDSKAAAIALRDSEELRRKQAYSRQSAMESANGL